MKILVPVDGSEYTKRMLGYLAAHDEWLGAHHDYTFIHVAPPVPARAAGALDKSIIKAHYEETIERVFKPIRTFMAKNGIQARFVGKVGHAADQIAALAVKDKPDLLVMGSHGHGSLATLVLGSVTTKVMAQCRVPVLIVR